MDYQTVVGWLEGHIIPELTFQDVTPRAAVETLRMEALGMETGGEDSGLSLSITLLAPDEVVDSPCVTRTLKDASLLTALRYVAGAMSMDVLVLSTGVLIGSKAVLHAIREEVVPVAKEETRMTLECAKESAAAAHPQIGIKGSAAGEKFTALFRGLGEDLRLVEGIADLVMVYPPPPSELEKLQSEINALQAEIKQERADDNFLTSEHEEKKERLVVLLIELKFAQFREQQAASPAS